MPLGEATRRATDFISKFILAGGDKTRLEAEVKTIIAKPSAFTEDSLRGELADTLLSAPSPPPITPSSTSTLASPGFVVSGKGNAESLNSASHGASRVMSRAQANKTFDWKNLKPAGTFSLHMQPGGCMLCTLNAVFKALADESRRKLLDRLHKSNGQTLGELCEQLEMTRQAVTKHLGLLEAANLITVVWQGREKLHYLNPVPLHEIYERWISKYERQRLQALSDLKKGLEETKNKK